MKDTTIVTIDTTQGEIKARALKHKEVKQIVAITRENPQDADERLEKIMAGCVVEGAEKLDDLEEHEIAELYDAIKTAGVENARKN